MDIFSMFAGFVLVVASVFAGVGHTVSQTATDTVDNAQNFLGMSEQRTTQQDIAAVQIAKSECQTDYDKQFATFMSLRGNEMVLRHTRNLVKLGYHNANLFIWSDDKLVAGYYATWDDNGKVQDAYKIDLTKPVRVSADLTVEVQDDYFCQVINEIQFGNRFNQEEFLLKYSLGQVKAPQNVVQYFATAIRETEG